MGTDSDQTYFFCQKLFQPCIKTLCVYVLCGRTCFYWKLMFTIVNISVPRWSYGVFVVFDEITNGRCKVNDFAS